MPLEQTRPDAACPACQAPQPYETDSTTGAPMIQYRLHGLIDRAADQGVLSHLLAIAALRNEHDHAFLIPGADIRLDDGTEREVDLFGIIDGTVVAGEAKTSPTGFDESDIEGRCGTLLRAWRRHPHDDRSRADSRGDHQPSQTAHTPSRTWA